MLDTENFNAVPFLNSRSFAHFLSLDSDGNSRESSAGSILKDTDKLPRVLVVDDEHVVADTIAEILGQNGFDPTVAYDYDHAFSAAESSAPDILITDVVMIGKTGVDLAIKIRDRFPATRIFLLSGQAVTSSVLNNARERGYDFELLAKPLHPTALLKALRGHGN